MYGYGLPGLHLLQLRFFEIGCDPEVIHGNDGQQLLSGLNALAGLHSFAADDTAHRRDDLCVTQIELRGGELGTGASSV